MILESLMHQRIGLSQIFSVRDLSESSRRIPAKGDTMHAQILFRIFLALCPRDCQNGDIFFLSLRLSLEKETLSIRHCIILYISVDFPAAFRQQIAHQDIRIAFIGSHGHH